MQLPLPERSVLSVQFGVWVTARQRQEGGEFYSKRPLTHARVTVVLIQTDWHLLLKRKLLKCPLVAGRGLIARIQSPAGNSFKPKTKELKDFLGETSIAGEANTSIEKEFIYHLLSSKHRPSNQTRL